jgi:leader peptidase (prepilin peptidase)/N-methyltransferase
VRFGWTWQLVHALAFVCLVVPLVFIDAETWILPFELTLPGIALGVLLAIPLGGEVVRDAALGAAGGFLLFRVLELFGYFAFRKEALGAGDKFLVAMVGAFLSWRVLLGVVFLSSLQGAVFGLARMALTGRAGPAPEPGAEGPDASAPEPEPTVTWEFTRPGLALWQRAVLVPWCLLLQPVPDEPEGEDGEEAEWVPGPSNLPFGPWIGLAGLELLFVGPWLAANVPIAGASALFGGG